MLGKAHSARYDFFKKCFHFHLFTCWERPIVRAPRAEGITQSSLVGGRESSIFKTRGVCQLFRKMKGLRVDLNHNYKKEAVQRRFEVSLSLLLGRYEDRVHLFVTTTGTYEARHNCWAVTCKFHIPGGRR